MTKYFVDDTGAYLGGFDGAEPPEGALEVPSAPADARQIWDGSSWSAQVIDLPPITPRQLRLTLLSIGITEAQVDAALVNDPAGQIEWKYATYFKRSHPLVEGLGAIFSITPVQIDSLWAYAQDL
ncbi:hypothetical protein [Mesorhizobium sp. M1252]|uniref:hypothetical protein n=1 Tax=Mesorhizobium sp. M1252 TaxID=2957073 RepID=UPI00333BBDD4